MGPKLRAAKAAKVARPRFMKSDFVGPGLQNCFPPIEYDQTDSGIFDNVLEVLSISGRPLPEVVTMMMPQAWENDASVSEELRDFYKYQVAVMEPWDGPVLVTY